MIKNSPQTTAIQDTEGRDDSSAAPLWLGYSPTGGRASLRFDELKGKLLIAGHAADAITSLLALACQEAGLRVLVLDADGRISERISGYFETYDYTCFLYDAFQLEEEEGPRHSQLIAAAYTAALGLSSEEEAILNAGLHNLAMKETLASPTVVFDTLEGVEGFRGFYVDKLKGRIGALKFLESTENGSFRSLLALGSSIISFKSAKYPQAAEVAVSIFVAKILAVLPGAKTGPHLVIVNDAHRLFRANPRPQHVSRLLTELLEASITLVLVSDQSRALSEMVQDAFPTKILSSDAWNEGIEGRWKANGRDAILPNAFVLADGHFGHQRTIIPRYFESKTSEPRKGPGVIEQKPADEELTALVLEDIGRFSAPTRVSIIEYLSGDYGTEEVKHELDRLQAQGHIKHESKPVRSGGDPMLVYSITPSGQRLLEALRN